MFLGQTILHASAAFEVRSAKICLMNKHLYILQICKLLLFFKTF